jgi:hypothetical protein
VLAGVARYIILHRPVPFYISYPSHLYILGIISRYSDIPIGIQYGFLMGLEHLRIINTSMPPNHYKLPEHDSFVKAKYDEELRLGQILPGFPPDMLHGWIGHFHTAPLNVIQQASGKLQVTVDHSFPRTALPPPPPSSILGDYVPFDPAQCRESGCAG